MTFDISWHLSFHDIWHFETFDISWHLTFRDIWHFMIFDIWHFITFVISWHLIFYDISSHLTFHHIWRLPSASSTLWKISNSPVNSSLIFCADFWTKESKDRNTIWTSSQLGGQLSTLKSKEDNRDISLPLAKAKNARINIIRYVHRSSFPNCVPLFHPLWEGFNNTSHGNSPLSGE